MNIFREEDLTLLNDRIEEIKNKIEKIKLYKFDPTIKEQKKVMSIIINFIKKNKRKIYGGVAINELIKNKNPKDAFYKEDEKVADIDFYSVDPVSDLHALCNIIFDEGFTSVIGREAQHPETYSIFVNGINYVDITYVPRNIYNTIPFIEIDGFIVTHPSFIKIDYYRMFSDPLTSYWRIEKAYTRFALLDNHYPEKKYTIPYNVNKPSVDINNVLIDIFEIISNNKDIICVGDYMYNYLYHESNIKNASYIKELPITKFEVILTKYAEQGSMIFNTLKDKYGDDIFITEYYPFFQLVGYRFEIYYKKHLVLCAENHNKKCIPYKIVEGNLFNLGKNKDKVITLASFDRNILYVMTRIQYNKTNDKKEEMSNYKVMLSHLLEMRKYYLDTNKKTILDESLFQEFMIECIGETIMPEQERQKLIESRRAKNQMIVYQYFPEKKKTDGTETKHSFYNTSGNIIRNPRNLRIMAESLSDDDMIDEENQDLME
jgi:hypothetical protein